MRGNCLCFPFDAQRAAKKDDNNFVRFEASKHILPQFKQNAPF
jgi:hypothetical protein